MTFKKIKDLPKAKVLKTGNMKKENMTLKKIKEIAKARGIKAGNMKKENIIRSIQKAEGNFDCFGTAVSGECDQVNCLWRENCLK